MNILNYTMNLIEEFKKIKVPGKNTMIRNRTANQLKRIRSGKSVGLGRNRAKEVQQNYASKQDLRNTVAATAKDLRNNASSSNPVMRTHDGKREIAKRHISKFRGLLGGPKD